MYINYYKLMNNIKLVIKSVNKRRKNNVQIFCIIYSCNYIKFCIYKNDLKFNNDMYIDMSLIIKAQIWNSNNQSSRH